MKKSLIFSAILASTVLAAPAYACLGTYDYPCGTEPWNEEIEGEAEEEEESDSDLTTISVKAGVIDAEGGDSAVGVLSIGKMFSGVVPLSLSAEAWQIAGGKNAFAGVAEGSVMLTEKTLFSVGGGVTRIESGGWETAPMARLGLSYIEGSMSLDIDYSRVFLDDVSDLNVTTAGVSIYF